MENIVDPFNCLIGIYAVKKKSIIKKDKDLETILNNNNKPFITNIKLP